MDDKFGFNHFKALIKKNAPKKQISVYLENATLERIDAVAKIFSAIGNSNFTRNELIQEAVSKFISEADVYLKDTHGADIDTLMDEMRISRKTNAPAL
jgi:hypothetical protein